MNFSMKNPLILWAILSSACAQPSALPDTDDAAYPAIERFIAVMEKVRKSHPDAEKLSYDQLVNHALHGMLSSLDPHSSFIHPEMRELMEKNQAFDPYIASLGMGIALENGVFSISHVIRYGAADQQKISPGDTLLAIDGQPHAKSSLMNICQTLQKPAGAKTKLLIQKPSHPSPIEVEVEHHKIYDRAIVTKIILPQQAGMGYIRLSQFTATADQEMEQALDELDQKGMKSLILDLRGNPGGVLDNTVRTLGLFLPPQTEVVSIRSRIAAPETLKTPEKQRGNRTHPLCILIDRQSASAAELMAATLQDLKRATIIGETSYGKGSVQKIEPMSGGTALHLTVATYHTPSGKSPHHTGVTPDHVIDFTDLDRQNFMLQADENALTPEQRAALSTWQDPALGKALALFPK